MSIQTEWASQQMLQWCQYLLDSYAYWVKQELIPRQGTAYDQAAYLFNCPFVVVSHEMQPDPVLNYGNRAALNLWEMNWRQFTQTPSRLTAEPVKREERARMLRQAKTQGYIADYRGVRISYTGKRFFVDQAVIWNVLSSDGSAIGQGATFSVWRFL
ncbi:MEKHLA domain-containing protein [Nitrosomonas sp. Nm51]|uniref:MEKHLA domain-containing protein n=1 Tax=Nitrosomonas sp. Nm51 TaxID=133720 RepID=UPI0008BC6545|nr:MEKHLA domain-containing protein [Nitrosomonas sp. Nm51]SER84953.1 MEKHLA domain-containing protein [Nitrosomonas sp. Nm51]